MVLASCLEPAEGWDGPGFLCVHHIILYGTKTERGVLLDF
jgi:hypothetical protein